MTHDRPPAPSGFEIEKWDEHKSASVDTVAGFPQLPSGGQDTFVPQLVEEPVQPRGWVQGSTPEQHAAWGKIACTPQPMHGGFRWLIAAIASLGAFLAIQIVAAVLTMFPAMMASSSASVSELTEIALVVAQLASIAIGLPWYRHLRHGNATRPVNFGGKPVILDETCPYPTVPRDVRRLIVMALLIVVLGIALQLGSSAALSLVEELSPHALQQYDELMESIVGDTLLSFLSVVILAPVSEEIFFRGVTCEMSRRIHPWYWVAIGVQALAFSVAHGNIVQGSYTLVIGLIFGVLCLRIGGLPASILAHAAVNGSAYVVGYMLSPFLAQGVTGLVLACVLAGVLTGLTLYGLLKLVKEPAQPVVS